MRNGSVYAYYYWALCYTGQYVTTNKPIKHRRCVHRSTHAYPPYHGHRSMQPPYLIAGAHQFHICSAGQLCHSTSVQEIALLVAERTQNPRIRPLCLRAMGMLLPVPGSNDTPHAG
jgi:hypothetical protein